MHSQDAVVVAVDQGTGSTKTVALGTDGRIVARAQVPVGQANPRPGWVEQAPEEVYASVVTSVHQVLDQISAPVAALGLSNQRESALVWETATGAALTPMLGWQDRRTAALGVELGRDGRADEVRRISGLPLDPMFSALKIRWLLDQVDPDRRRSAAGEITVGTEDAWLRQRLTGERVVEVGNASRTQLLDVASATWSADLLDLFGVPAAALPPVVDSDHRGPAVAGLHPRLVGVGLDGVLGDSHAALFAHGVRAPGAVKATYGTGSSVMGLTDRPVPADAGVVETLGWRVGGVTGRAFEGNVLSVGSTLLWVAELLGLTAEELAGEAAAAPDNGGVYLVPAFAGLGAPYWDEAAAAVLTGFGPGNGRPQLARAALESVPLQIEDVLERADQVTGVRTTTVLADGGPTRNDWLMQRQADLSDRQVARSDVAELSVTGAAHVAGMSAGVWTAEDVAALPRARSTFDPATGSGTEADRTTTRSAWAAAVSRARLRG